LISDCDNAVLNTLTSHISQAWYVVISEPIYTFLLLSVIVQALSIDFVALDVTSTPSTYINKLVQFQVNTKCVFHATFEPVIYLLNSVQEELYNLIVNFSALSLYVYIADVLGLLISGVIYVILSKVHVVVKSTQVETVNAFATQIDCAVVLAKELELPLNVDISLTYQKGAVL